MSQNERSPVLSRLNALVGVWEFEASLRGQPYRVRGRSTFEWQEGGSFLVQYVDAEATPETPPELAALAPYPTVAIIGLDDSSERFTMLYADARNVFRVYEMSLSDGVWELWRESPGFFQRFTGVFSNDGRTITSRGEMSRDGTNWEPDVEFVYAKVT